MDERHRQSMTVSAKTVDEAIDEAARELGVPRENLDITVITEGSKGFLGMRAENARILAMVVGGAPAPPAAPGVESVAVADPTPIPAATGTEPAPYGEDPGAPGPMLDDPLVEGLDQNYEDKGEGEVSDAAGGRSHERQDTARAAQEILERLLGYMKMPARVSVRDASDPIVLDVETDDGGLLIGRRGETLSALQYLVNVLIGKRTRRWTKVVIDVEHWRERREETLRALALRQADRVRQQQRPIALDPMPANERRIIHVTLQDMRDIATRSEGEEPNRRLVILPRG